MTKSMGPAREEPEARRFGPGRAQFQGLHSADWIACLGALLALYVPTYVDLARGPWTNPQEAHGPFILAIAVGAAYARRDAFTRMGERAPRAGFGLLGLGLVFYVLGRSQEFLVLETASQVPVLAGMVLVLAGWGGLGRLWFPVVFMAFTIIWPSWVIDTFTLPLKRGAAEMTVELLYSLGYPIASTGVVIAIGQYKLQVADACSGLNTIISLLSVGVLYLYMAQRPGLARNLVLVAAMPAIAFGANVLRVIVLTLITYHFGDAAGQGFLHDFTGLFLFAAALGGVFLIDVIVDGGARLNAAIQGRAMETAR